MPKEPGERDYASTLDVIPFDDTNMTSSKAGNFGEQHEGIMRPGESPASNEVVNTIAAARQALGERFDIGAVLGATKFATLPDLEKAWVQKRLRQELNITLPQDLQVDETALDQAAQPQVRREPPRPTPRRKEKAPEEKVQGFATIIEQAFNRAKDRGDGFDLSEYLGRYSSQLSSQELHMIEDELERRGVEDIVIGFDAEVKEPTQAEALQGKPPEPELKSRIAPRSVQFRYDLGRGEFREYFIENFYDDTGRIARREERERSVTFIQLPKEAQTIAKDPEKLQKFLDELGIIYRNAALVNFSLEQNPQNGEERVYAEMAAAPSAPVREIPLSRISAEMLEMLRKGQVRVPRFQTLAFDLRKELRAEYMRDKTAELVRSLLGEKLTPQEVGLTPERAGRLRELTRGQVIAEYRKALQAKYPRMKPGTAKDAAEAILTDEDVEKAFQQALRTLKDRGKN